MPKYEDLEFIRNKILNIGDEINVKKKLGMSTEVLPLPQKVEEPQEEENLEDFEGLIQDIKEDFDKGLLVEEDVSENIPMDKETEQENINFDSLLDTDKKELDSSFEDMFEKKEESIEEESIEKETMPEITTQETTPEETTIEESQIKETEIDNLLADLGLTDEQEKKVEQPIMDLSSETFNLEQENLLQEFTDLSNIEQPFETEKAEAEKEEIEKTLKDSELESIPLEGEGIESMVETDDLSKNIIKEEAKGIEDIFEPENKEIGEILVTDENALKDLAGDFLTTPEQEIEPITEKKEIEQEMPLEELSQPIEQVEDFSDLDKLIEEKEEKKVESNRAQLIEIQEEEPKLDVENLFEQPEEIEQEPLSTEPTTEATEIEGIEQLEEEKKIEEEPITPIEAEQEIDLSSLDQFKIESEPIVVEEETKPAEESLLSEIPIKEIPVEEKEEKEIKEKKKEKKPLEKDEIELTDEQIKQILFSLSQLPKEAELKIAREIVSNKYSDKQWKPLIDALLEREKPQIIIKIYEKITGDKSLSKITAVRYTGEEFEEKQKSFAYLFQKNILPILYRLTAISIFTLMIILLIVNILIPTMRATHYYNLGKKNIDQKKFNEVEPYFERAYEIQPRYNEVVIYARKYRENKRYLEAEKKYYLALQMKDNKNLKLEIADFFRETKDYERSIRNYLQLKQQNDKDIKILLGMAKTYYEWADEIPAKLEDAKELYYDVIDIDKNNRDALYGNMNIFIRQKNNEEVLKHYRYIEKKFKDNIDPVAYLNLAEYFIETNQIEEVKNVLDKSLKRSDKLRLNLPEIDYLYARYNNSLNIFNEEKKYLERALNKFNKMRNQNPDLFGTQKYQKLLARVYNDLGENYDRFAKANIDAEKYYNMAINTDPDYGKPYFNLANFELKYKVDMISAKEHYKNAEDRGFLNDRLIYNVGWISFKQEDYLESFRRINSLLEKYPENSNLKFFVGTIFYKLQNYDFAEGFLLETYNYFNNLKQIYYPLEMDVKEDRIIADMLLKISNNLGATYQKKFEKTRNSKYLVWATKYYSESMEYNDKLKEYPLLKQTKEETLSEAEIKLKKFEVTKATQNLRMVLYPDAGKDEPIIFEDFPLDYESSL